MRSAAVFAAILLSSCNDAPPDAQPSAPHPAEMQSAKGLGTVIAVGREAGTITIDHQPMPEVGWPAMTMTFEAAPALLADVAEGDTVTFDLTMIDGRSRIANLRVE